MDEIMLKIIITFPLFIIIFSSCSIITPGISGSQQLQIRTWRNETPNILENIRRDAFALDVNAENIIEFDVKVFSNVVYVAYTTDQNVQTSKYPNINTLPNSLLSSITATDNILQYSIIETTTTIREVYCRIMGSTPATSIISDPILFNQRTQNKKGVWFRMFKGTLEGTDRNPTLTWEPLIITKDPIEIGKIVILPLYRQTATVLAITNNSKVMVFNDVDRNGIINIIENDLLKKTYNNISQLNTWVNGTKTYVSLVADKHVITGYYNNLLWIPTVDSIFNFDIQKMQVKMGVEFAYGVWMDNTQKEAVIAIYQEGSNNKRRWLEIDRISAVEYPKINISTYKNSLGSHEDIFIGTVNQNQDFFQLFTIKNLQTFFSGQIITGWNERYTITGNELGQLLYVRANGNQQLIFAGLNVFNQWDPIQLVSPPPVNIHPNSQMQGFFLNNSYSLTVFRQENGSIYFLAGIR